VRGTRYGVRAMAGQEEPRAVGMAEAGGAAGTHGKRHDRQAERKLPGADGRLQTLGIEWVTHDSAIHV